MSTQDKLAEALRRTCRKMKTFSRTGALDGAVAVWVDEIESALVAHAAEAAQAQAQCVPGELAEPVEGVLNYEQERSFAEGWNACRNAMLAAAPQAQDTKE